MEAMFQNALSFNQSLLGWKTGEVTTMESMFDGANKFNQKLDTWDMRKVVNVNYMFQGAVSFNQSLNAWNTGTFQFASAMFRGATGYNRPMNLWDVSKITDFSYMFSSASIFDQDISDWCVEHIPSIPVGFKDACPLNAVNSPKWGFSCVGALLDIWYDAADKSTMFQKADKTIPVTGPGQPVGYIVDITGNGYDGKQVDDSKRPIYRQDASGKGYLEFNNDQHLDIPIIKPIITLMWAIPSIGAIQFKGLNSNGNFELGPFADDPNKTWHMANVAITFRNLNTTDDTKLMGTMANSAASYAPGTIQSLQYYLYKEAGFNGVVDSWNTAKVTNFEHLFDGAVNFNQPVASWDTSMGINFSYMFANTSGFNQPLNGLDTPAAKNLSYMFYRAFAFNQNISSWDVSQVTDFSHMFEEAVAYNRLINNWNVSSGLDFSFMFRKAKVYDQDLGNWSTISAQTMESMFEEAEAFNRPILQI
jgi:surface protein